VEHVKRMSTNMATLADHLSRSETTTEKDLKATGHVPWNALEGPLVEWLADLVLDWQLPNKLSQW
jgi:hypothetical protein